jgi:hypothetical protein
MGHVTPLSSPERKFVVIRLDYTPQAGRECGVRRTFRDGEVGWQDTFHCTALSGGVDFGGI